MAEISLEDAPKKAKDLYQRGLSAFERNNLEFAIELFTTCLDLEPRLLVARKYLRAAEIKIAKQGKASMTAGLKGSMKKGAVLKAIKKGEGLDAVKKAEEILRIDPLNAEFIMLFSDAAEAAELPEAAIQTMEIAREHYPSDKKLLNALGALYTRNEFYQQAREVYEQASDLDLSDLKALQMVKDAAAKATVERGNWDTKGSYRDILVDREAAEKLEKEQASERTSEDVTAQIEDAQKKIEQEPANLNYRRGLADLYLKAKMFEEALEVLNTSNEMAGGADPQIDSMISKTTLMIYDHNIEVCREEGNEQEALETEAEKQVFLIEDAAEKVRRYPNDLKFKFAYARLLLDKNEVDSAIPLFQASCRNPEQRIESLYYLGMCFQAKGLPDMAIDQLTKAVSELKVMDDSKKEILYQLGRINEGMNHPDEALAFFKEVYAVDFSYKDVQQRVENFSRQPDDVDDAAQA